MQEKITNQETNKLQEIQANYLTLLSARRILAYQVEFWDAEGQDKLSEIDDNLSFLIGELNKLKEKS